MFIDLLTTVLHYIKVLNISIPSIIEFKSSYMISEWMAKQREVQPFTRNKRKEEKIKIQPMCMLYNVILRHVRVTTFAVEKEINFTYYGGVSVTLVIEHAKLMC
jgi:hypothetical protein